MTKICKKCNKELPDDRNDKLCKECREKRKEKIKKIFVGLAVGGAVVTVTAVLTALVSRKKDDGCDFDDDYDYDDDNDNGEAISVWDAADIYLSSGFDEDYQFGYTHEELTNALDE